MAYCIGPRGIYRLAKSVSFFQYAQSDLTHNVMASLFVLTSAVLDFLTLLNDGIETAALPAPNDTRTDATASGSPHSLLFATTSSLMCLVALSRLFSGVCTTRRPTRVLYIDTS